VAISYNILMNAKSRCQKHCSQPFRIVARYTCDGFQCNCTDPGDSESGRERTQVNLCTGQSVHAQMMQLPIVVQSRTHTSAMAGLPLRAGCHCSHSPPTVTEGCHTTGIEYSLNMQTTHALCCVKHSRSRGSSPQLCGRGTQGSTTVAYKRHRSCMQGRGGPHIYIH
jgi:hypothetical protein